LLRPAASKTGVHGRLRFPLKFRFRTATKEDGAGDPQIAAGALRKEEFRLVTI
jgi:hypothetical protein